MRKTISKYKQGFCRKNNRQPFFFTTEQHRPSTECTEAHCFPYKRRRTESLENCLHSLLPHCKGDKNAFDLTKAMGFLKVLNAKVLRTKRIMRLKNKLKKLLVSTDQQFQFYYVFSQIAVLL